MVHPKKGSSSTKKKLSSLIARAKAEKSASIARKKARAEALLALIGRRKQRMVEDFYDIGEALRELLDQKLYVALGHASFEAMLGAHEVMSPTQAKKLIALVTNVPRDHALALGQEKAYELLAYTAATPEADTPAGLATANAKIGSKRVAEASVRDLKAATKAVRAKQKIARPPSDAERQAARLARDARAKVAAVLRKAGITRPEIEVTREAIVVRLTIRQAAGLR